jgi:hypothetical protein
MSQPCSSAFINLNFLQFAKQSPLNAYYKCTKRNRVCTFLNYDNTERLSMKFRVTRAGVCNISCRASLYASCSHVYRDSYLFEELEQITLMKFHSSYEIFVYEIQISSRLYRVHFKHLYMGRIKLNIRKINTETSDRTNHQFRIQRFEVTETIRRTTKNSMYLNSLKQSFTVQTHMLYDNHSHDDNSVGGMMISTQHVFAFRESSQYYVNSNSSHH